MPSRRLYITLLNCCSKLNYLFLVVLITSPKPLYKCDSFHLTIGHDMTACIFKSCFAAITYTVTINDNATLSVSFTIIWFALKFNGIKIN